MKLTSSAQEARCIAWTPSQSSASASNRPSQKSTAVACRPPFATEKTDNWQTTMRSLWKGEKAEGYTSTTRKKPDLVDASLCETPAGLDTLSLFNINYRPRGIKPIIQPPSEFPESTPVFGLSL